MPFRPLALAGLGLLLSSCAHLDRTSSAVNAIQAPALQAHMAFLADDRLAGRMTGTPGYDLAAAYVQSQFQAIGLEPGMGQSFLQQVPLLSGQLDIRASSLQIEGLRGRKALRFREDFVLDAKLSAEKELIHAPLVFVGHGIVAPSLGHDDFAGVDVRGKIVVLFPRAPKTFPADERAFYSSGRLKAYTAAERGAVGVITVRNQYSRSRYAWEDVAKNAGVEPTMRWTDAEGQPKDYEARIRGSAVLSDTLAEQVFAAGPHPLSQLLAAEEAGETLPRFALPLRARLQTRTRISRLESPNVVARLPGTDPALAGEHVVLVAHLDHLGHGEAVDGDPIYNGAYDNAMGVGLMLETARALKAMGTRRSVLFAAVTAEERGLLGSHYLAQKPPPKVEKMVAALTLDMPLLLFPMQEVIGFGAEHSNLGSYVRQAAQAEGMALAADPMPNEVLFIRSDHYSFVREGVPGLFFFPGFASADPAIDGSQLVFGHLAEHYHKPSDDLRRPVHWPSAERFARVNTRLAKAIADGQEAPHWAANNFFAAQFAGQQPSSEDESSIRAPVHRLTY